MHTRQYVFFVNGLAQSGVAISRKCCFPRGRSLAVSYLNDPTALQSLIQRVKEIDKSLGTHDDEYIASTPVEILFSGPGNMNSTHPDGTTSDHNCQHRYEFDSYTEVA